MTVNELFSILIPILGIILLIILIIIGVQLVGIVGRARKLIERVDNYSDVATWINIIRRLPKKKSKES